MRNISSSFFFFNDTATTEIYTLSLHDALPISFGENMPMAIALVTEKTAGSQSDLYGNSTPRQICQAAFIITMDAKAESRTLRASYCTPLGLHDEGDAFGSRYQSFHFYFCRTRR